MSHATFTAEIEDWLIGKALIDPDIRALFEKLCERMMALGVPLARASLSWPTLHPLFRAEQVFWWPDEGARLEQYYHSSAGTEAWLKSPLHHVQSTRLPSLRRRLTGESALLDFEVLESFRDQGFTDYLVTSTDFRIAEVKEFAGGRTGIIASWATKRVNGFSDDDLDALKRIQRFFAVACHAAIQKRVMANVATAYLGATAGTRVLAGDIKRGDGQHIPAVIWYSDLRGSTRLSDTMAPDSYIALLNRYFECTAQPVIDEGGEILNFIGDGVLAIFPITQGCPADAAARAERAVAEALSRREAAQRDGTPEDCPLQFGVGLAVGEVMFGNIGVPGRLAFSGIGRAVNAVQRVEAANKVLGTEVLALADFVAAAPGNWVSAGEIEIPDFDRRVEVFSMAAARPAAEPAVAEPAAQPAE